MIICPHCGMYMKPFRDGTCEFCGQDVQTPPQRATEP
jgi:hypothetical protein